jgi:hypothetical protein
MSGMIADGTGRGRLVPDIETEVLFMFNHTRSVSHLKAARPQCGEGTWHIEVPELSARSPKKACDLKHREQCKRSLLPHLADMPQVKTLCMYCDHVNNIDGVSGDAW